jgi:hypothetical protein
MAPPRFVVACVAALCGVRRRARAQLSGDPSVLLNSAEPMTIKDSWSCGHREASRSWWRRSIVECEGGNGSWRGVVRSSRSWWREINRNIWQGSDDPSLLAPRDDGGRGLLAHEQLHFDLTELWARKIRALLTTLPSACKTPGASRMFETRIAEMQRNWLEDLKQYDEETDHGMAAARQKAWAARAAKALKEF